MLSSMRRTRTRSSRSESGLVYPYAQMLTTRFTCSFSAAFAKLMELGIPTSQFVTPEPWIMKNLDEKE